MAIGDWWQKNRGAVIGGALGGPIGAGFGLGFDKQRQTDEDISRVIGQIPQYQQAGFREAGPASTGTMMTPEQEAAYVQRLRGELGIQGPADIRETQYEALYNQADKFLGAANAGLDTRGIQGPLRQSQMRGIVGETLLPAAAGIEQQYAQALAADQAGMLGMAQGRGQQFLGSTQFNAAQRNAMARAGADAYNQWAQAQADREYQSRLLPVEARLGQLTGQYAQRGQMLGGGFQGLGSVVGGALGMGRG